MISLENMTVLERGAIFLDAYESEQYKTWDQVQTAFAPGLTVDTVRGYGSRARTQRDERQMRTERQLSITLNGGKEPRNTYTRVNLRSAVFDIEVTDFGSAGYKGFLICCCILPLDSDEVQTYQIEFGEEDDKRVLAETIQALSKYDILIGHFINGFDLPWLASRIAWHNLPTFRRWFYIDTFTWAKRLRLRSRKKLSTLIDYFGITGIKTGIEVSSWNDVRSPFPDTFHESRDDIIYHCEHDVKANREVFYALYPRVMETRYSSSSPIGIFDIGSGAGANGYDDPEHLLKMHKRIKRAEQ
jgi:hypothetical protein